MCDYYWCYFSVWLCGGARYACMPYSARSNRALFSFWRRRACAILHSFLSNIICPFFADMYLGVLVLYLSCIFSQHLLKMIFFLRFFSHPRRAAKPSSMPFVCLFVPRSSRKTTTSSEWEKKVVKVAMGTNPDWHRIEGWRWQQQHA